MSFFIFVFPWVYNSSIALKMLLHCPLICNESSANSKVILTFVPLYKNVFLFLAPFKVFSLLLLLSSLNVMCHGVFFFLFWCLWVVELRGYWVFIQFSSVQSLSGVQLFATPWIAAHQASLSITNFRSSLRLTSIESVMPSSHLILCAAAESFQSCPTLCDPIDGSPPDSPVPGILQARTLEWVAISDRKSVV